MSVSLMKPKCFHVQYFYTLTCAHTGVSNAVISVGPCLIIEFSVYLQLSFLDRMIMTLNKLCKPKHTPSMYRDGHSIYYIPKHPSIHLSII